MSSGIKLKLAVRDLVEFAARSGDLSQSYHKTPTHLEGVEGHKFVQSQRSEDWDKEYFVKQVFKFDSHQITLQGRADLVHFKDFIVEEIKTTFVNEISDGKFSVDLAQAKVYAYMLWPDQDRVSTVVNYFHLEEKVENKKIFEYSSSELLSEVQQYMKVYLDFYLKYLDHSKKFLNELKNVEFPYAEYRPSQRGIAREIYRNIRDKESLMFEAPTGTGKSMSALFPASKALAMGESKQVLYLSAKTAAQQSALDALRVISKDHFSCLQITAREKISKRTDPDVIKGYYDRLPEARLEALDVGFLDTKTLINLAAKYQLCPFELTLEMIPWQKVIIADFNYYFDPMVAFDYFDNLKIDLLIDESHNLIDRVREMYSISLDTAHLEKIKKLLKTKLAKTNCRKVIVAIQKKFDELSKGKHLAKFKFVSDLLTEFLDSCAVEFEQEQQSLPGLESKEDLRNELKDLYRFLKLYDCCKTDDIFFIDKYRLTRNPKIRLQILCSRVGRHLKSKWKKAKSLTLFSATLSPDFYFKKNLGLEESKFYKLPPVFDNVNQLSLALNFIDTRWQNRDQSLNTLCKTILAIYEKYPGKHIVYFPSYKYLEMAKSILEKEAHCVCQENSTSEKDYFLKHFFGKNEAVLGLAILGGALAEGVDFKGDALNSCLIVGTGMPQPSFEKEQLGLNLSQQGLNVFEYNFLIPGITRLIQTAGRLIRSEKDKGILVLIDPRFSLDQYCRYLPVHWNLNKVNTLGHGLKLIEEFAANEKV